MSEPSRRDNIKKEIRSLRSLLSDLEEKIDRLEDLIESSDEESNVDIVELQTSYRPAYLRIGTVITFINENDQLGFCPPPLKKHAVVVALQNPIASAVKSPWSHQVSLIANTKFQATSIQEASDFRDTARRFYDATR